jgi:hypothetical protein
MSTFQFIAFLTMAFFCGRLCSLISQYMRTPPHSFYRRHRMANRVLYGTLMFILAAATFAITFIP